MNDLFQERRFLASMVSVRVRPEALKLENER